MFCPEFPSASLSSHVNFNNMWSQSWKKGLQNLQLPGDLKPSFEGLEVEEEALGTCPQNTA